MSKITREELLRLTDNAIKALDVVNETVHYNYLEEIIKALDATKDFLNDDKQYNLSLAADLLNRAVRVLEHDDLDEWDIQDILHTLRYWVCGGPYPVGYYIEDDWDKERVEAYDEDEATCSRPDWDDIDEPSLCIKSGENSYSCTDGRCDCWNGIVGKEGLAAKFNSFADSFRTISPALENDCRTIAILLVDGKFDQLKSWIDKAEADFLPIHPGSVEFEKFERDVNNCLRDARVFCKI